MGNPRCRWVRDRLPLLVGDDLRGLDRRRVERHLIGCPTCRQHQAALGQALETLRTVASTPPAQRDAPSLWPALARQIRESRRPVPTRTFPWSLASPWLRVNPWPVLGFGLGLGLLALIVAGLGVRPKTVAAPAPAPSIAPGRPVLAARASHPLPPAEREKLPAPKPLPWREPPAPVETPVVEGTPRLYYPELDAGRPMPYETREPRDTKATY